MESSAGGTSPCRGCTAAVPRPPSPPPERWNCGTIPTILTHPGYPWLAGAGAWVPVCLSLHLAGCLLIPKLPPWTATTTGGWIPPGFRDTEMLQDMIYSHLPLHSCSSCWSQSQAQARCSSKATSCFSVLASEPVCDVFNIIVIVLLSTEEGTQATPRWHRPWHLITCTSRGSR